MFLDFLLQVTAFVALVTLDIRRAESGRVDCLPCLQVAGREEATVGESRQRSLLERYMEVRLLGFQKADRDWFGVISLDSKGLYVNRIGSDWKRMTAPSIRFSGKAAELIKCKKKSAFVVGWHAQSPLSHSSRALKMSYFLSGTKRTLIDIPDVPFRAGPFCQDSVSSNRASHLRFPSERPALCH